MNTSESEDVRVFAIKRSSAGAVEIYLSDDSVLNYYVTDTYTLVIRALDTQNPSLYGQVTVLFFVNKTSAKRPLFDREHYSTTLQENSPDGSSVLSVKALVDGKPSTNVMYSIRSQEFKSGSRANAFTITNSGVLQVANSVQLDYEFVREITVAIVASLTQPVLRTSETIAVISLSDVTTIRLCSAKRYILHRTLLSDCLAVSASSTPVQSTPIQVKFFR